MSHNYSPGLDGLPAEFYIVFFHDIADLLIASLNFAFEQGILSSSERNGVVKLLPKKDRDPNFVNYRSISCLLQFWKILEVPVLENFKGVMPFNFILNTLTNC